MPDNANDIKLPFIELDLKLDSANETKEDSEQVRANFEGLSRRASELGTTRLTQFNQLPRDVIDKTDDLLQLVLRADIEDSFVRAYGEDSEPPEVTRQMLRDQLEIERLAELRLGIPARQFE